MNARNQPQGRFSLWKAKPESKAVFTGTIELPVHVIAEIIDLVGDGRPSVQLKLIGFANDSDKPNAPKYTGYANLPDAAPRLPHRNPCIAPKHEEIPF